MCSPHPVVPAAFLLALALSAPPARAQSADELADVRQYVNGLSWRVWGDAVFAQGDDYFVRAGLVFDRRYRDRMMTLRPGGLVLELARPDGPPRTHVLIRAALPKAYKMDHPDGLDVSFDLRDAFGELEPGPWVARWILREGRYRVEGRDTSSEVVAEYPFSVLATTKKLAALKSKPTADVVLDVSPRDPGSRNQATATLTNHTDKAIEFAAYPTNADPDRPTWREPMDVSAAISVERYVPPGSWKGFGVPFCGSRWVYKLDPGRSVRVTVSPLRGAQLVRVRLAYRLAGDLTFAPHEAVSDVVESPPRR